MSSTVSYRCAARRALPLAACLLACLLSTACQDRRDPLKPVKPTVAPVGTAQRSA